jgi:hypothetical protein
MTSLRRFTCSDLFNFNSINLDPLTETVRALCATAQTFECLHQTRFHCRPFAAEPLPALTERCPLCSMLSTSTCSTWQHGRSTARCLGRNNMGYGAPFSSCPIWDAQTLQVLSSCLITVCYRSACMYVLVWLVYA